MLFLEQDPFQLLGTTYEFSHLENKLREARVFASVLNACGKEGKAEVGLKVALYKYMVPEAEAIVRRHGRHVITGLQWAKDHLFDLGRFLFLDGRGHIEPGALSAVVSFLAPEDKPIVGVSGSRNLKVSARGGKAVLGTWVREAAADVGGRGGGHERAAGAVIPEDKLREFLWALHEHYATGHSE